MDNNKQSAKQLRSSSRIMHDVVSSASTILSITQMAMFTQELSDETRADIERVMEAAHEIVAHIDELGQILESDDDD